MDGKTDGLLFFTASNTPGKLSPHAHLSDGYHAQALIDVYILASDILFDLSRIYMDVSLITHCSRLRLTRLLMKDDKLKINANDAVPSTSTANAEACIPHPLPNSGYHIRQYKTSQIHLEVDRY